MRFLDPQRKVKQLGADIPAEQLHDREVIIVLDTTRLDPTGQDGRRAAGRAGRSRWSSTITSARTTWGPTLFKNTEAEATGRLVVEAADALGVPLTPEIAEPLFAALATDTGWFRFASTTAGDVPAGGAAGGCRGARPTGSTSSSTRTTAWPGLQLIGRTLARTRTELGGRLIHTWIERADFEATGALASDTEDIINMTLTVGGTEVALILVEQPGGVQAQPPQPLRTWIAAGWPSNSAAADTRRAAGATLNEPLAGPGPKSSTRCARNGRRWG